jgi:inhibitor of cysteine peptidase
MKSKPLVAASMVGISLLVLACSPASEQASVEVPCDDFYENHHIGKEVQVAVGDSFAVDLCSNPSTGFQWSETASISDQTVLQQTDHKHVAPEAKGIKPPAPGTPGKEIWTFKALEKGTSTVSLEYSRPWEGGEKGEWTFNLTVVVK